MTDEPDALEKAAESYADLVVLRAAVSAIPWVGGPLDVLISGGAARIQARRVREFLTALDSRLQELEHANADFNSEGFTDLMLATLGYVAQSRTASKRERFAAVIRNQAELGRPWEEPEMAVRLLASLDDIHFDVLALALKGRGPGVWDGPRVVYLGSAEVAVPPGNCNLPSELPHHSRPALRLACSELVGKGLLLDYRVGRWGSGSDPAYTATELASWFSKWVTDAQ